MKLKFVNADEFLAAIERIKSILKFEIDEKGIEIELEKSDKSGVEFDGSKGKIYYKEKINVFRNIGILVENLKEKKSFSICDNTQFEMIGDMLSVARGCPLKIEAIKKHIDYLAVMGYNMLMLYVEDAFKIDGYEHFGYLNGGYTKEELKECDDYAYDYGIEMIPCLECYGHLGGYLLWDEAEEVKDTPTVLLAGEEKTYKLIEAMIKASSETFRSKRVHIGMDEAWNMGRGKYLDINGYVEPIEIFKKHMDRIIEITNKYNYKPMMWSDMYLREAAGTKYGYYEENSVITEEIKNAVPKEVQLVYWHYGEKPGCDEYMIEKHKELERDIIFAGGVWTWSGHLPDTLYAFEATEAAMKAVKKAGLKEMMTTIWRTAGIDISHDTALLTLSYTAELAYNENPDTEFIKKRFNTCTGGDYDAFMEMSYYHNDFDCNSYDDFNDRFLGNALFWQDILCGMYDKNLYEKNMSGHYLKHSKIMEKYLNNDTWADLYSYTYEIFKFLHIKTKIAEMLKPAYDKGDTKTLLKIADELLPQLKAQLDVVHKKDRGYCLKNSKGMSALSMDLRYGGMNARIDTAILRLKDYLAGDIKEIEELSEKRLYRKPSPFTEYVSVVTMNESL